MTNYRLKNTQIKTKKDASNIEKNTKNTYSKNNKKLFENSENNILTVEELSCKLKVSKDTIYKLVKTKQIPFFKIGRHYRFNFNQVLTFLNKINFKDKAGHSTTLKKEYKWLA